MAGGSGGFLQGMKEKLSSLWGSRSSDGCGQYDVFEAIRPIGKGSARRTLPVARSGHRVWTDGDFLYSIGGYNPDEVQDMFAAEAEEANVASPLLLELWRLNLVTETWEEVETSGNFPKTMASFALAHDPVGARLLVFGGTAIPFGNTASNELHALTLKGREPFRWSELHLKGASPESGYGQAFVRTGPSEFHLLGGTSGFQYNMLVHRFSLWRAPPPQEDAHFAGTSQNALRGSQCEMRYRHEALVHRGKVLVFGGGTREACVSLQNLDAFDLETQLWGAVGTLADPTQMTAEGGGGFPAPRRCHALVRHGSRAVLIGGFDGERLYDDVWILHLDDTDEGPFQWEKHRSSLPKPLYFHSADVTPEGCVYVFGGVVDAHGSQRSAETHRFWLTPPPLQWIAARRLFAAQPSLLARPRAELRRLGLPLALLHSALPPDNPA